MIYKLPVKNREFLLSVSCFTAIDACGFSRNKSASTNLVTASNTKEPSMQYTDRAPPLTGKRFLITSFHINCLLGFGCGRSGLDCHPVKQLISIGYATWKFHRHDWLMSDLPHSTMHRYAHRPSYMLRQNRFRILSP